MCVLVSPGVILVYLLVGVVEGPEEPDAVAVGHVLPPVDRVTRQVARHRAVECDGRAHQARRRLGRHRHVNGAATHTYNHTQNKSG